MQTKTLNGIYYNTNANEMKKKKTKCISQTLAIKIAMALKKYIALTIAIAFNLLSHSYLCTSFPRLYAKTVNAETITLCEQNELQNIHSKCSFGLLLKHDDERKKNLDKTSGIDRLNVRVVYRVWNRKSACILAFLFIFTPSTIQNAVEEKKTTTKNARNIPFGCWNVHHEYVNKTVFSV